MSGTPKLEIKRPLPMHPGNFLLMLLFSESTLEPDQLQSVLVDLDSSIGDPVRLLAHLLSRQIDKIAARGFDRSYNTHINPLHAIRGRLLTFETHSLAVRTGKLFPVCEYEDYTIQTLPNKILRQTIINLLKVIPDVSSSHQELSHALRQLPPVAPIHIRSETFGQVILHAGNRHYRPALFLCRLAHTLFSPTETAEHPFDLRCQTRQQQHRLFEVFLQNAIGFLAESPASQRVLRWDPALHPHPLIPNMQADLIVHTPAHVTILDAKLYNKPLTNGKYFTSTRSALKIRSNHLYQLLTYIHAYERQFSAALPVHGVLFYGTPHLQNQPPDTCYRVNSYLLLNRQISLYEVALNNYLSWNTWKQLFHQILGT